MEIKPVGNIKTQQPKIDQISKYHKLFYKNIENLKRNGLAFRKLIIVGIYTYLPCLQLILDLNPDFVANSINNLVKQRRDKVRVEFESFFRLTLLQWLLLELKVLKSK